MKKFHVIILVASLMLACKNKKTVQTPPPPPPPPIAIDAPHHAKNALDWAGLYSGIIPCADCKGIKVGLELKSDGTYLYKSEYIGKLDEPYLEEGEFSWDERNLNVISLNKKVDRPIHFLVQENSLLQLGDNKEIIESSLADKYRLYKEKKTASILGNKKWLLKEIYGERINPEDSMKQVFLNFSSYKEIHGNGGCNSFFGSYKIEKGNRIQFSGIGMTEMACMTKNYDEEIVKALEEADNFVIAKENELRLQTGKRAAHAIFVSE